tara:strand:- start:342 stop:713 length:372 start_codon:yes stop_codon:yes gene_type:complete
VEINHLGCFAEYLFCAECTKRGYTVSMPILDSSIYDCIVDTGYDLFKVQIKSSEKTPRDNENSVNIPLDNSKSKYTKDKVQYFAVYSGFYKGFFVFPNLGNMKSFRASRKGKNKVYYNNFNLV